MHHSDQDDNFRNDNNNGKTKLMHKNNQRSDNKDEEMTCFNNSSNKSNVQDEKGKINTDNSTQSQPGNTTRPSPSASPAGQHPSSCCRKSGSLSKAVGTVLKGIEEWMFPRLETIHTTATTTANNSRGNDVSNEQLRRRRERETILLLGCHNLEEHDQKVRHLMNQIRDRQGADGLAQAGFEYRMVLCPEHRPSPLPTPASVTNLATSILSDSDNNHENDGKDATIASLDVLLSEGQTNAEHMRTQNMRKESKTTTKQEECVESHSVQGNDHGNQDADDAGSSASSETRWSVKSLASSEVRMQQSLEAHPPTTSSLSSASYSSSSPSPPPSDPVANMHQKNSETDGKTENYLASLPPPSPRVPPVCHLCQERLFHMETNTLITLENRQQFIVDGEMYEAMAELCQDYAHSVMCREIPMEWIPIIDEDNTTTSSNNNPQESPSQQSLSTPQDGRPPPGAVWALVNSHNPRIETSQWKASHGNIAAENDPESDSPNNRSKQASSSSLLHGRPTLLIGTGRGKVRAGIFSRKHLICTSIESSTALPFLREAKARNLNVVIPDPNARGDRLGYDTFCKSMKSLFGVSSSSSTDQMAEQELYILSHSASGGHLQRYLMDHAPDLVPSIRAIAFTDSTHNIQWCKPPQTQPATSSRPSPTSNSTPFFKPFWKKQPDQQTEQNKAASNHDEDQKQKIQNLSALYNLLESPKCVYFRYSNPDQDARWYLHVTGEQIKTDDFWQHRFGQIRTYWAGTKEHCLTNWYAQTKIWKHFDVYLRKSSTTLLSASCATIKATNQT